MKHLSDKLLLLGLVLGITTFTVLTMTSTDVYACALGLGSNSDGCTPEMYTLPPQGPDYTPVFILIGAVLIGCLIGFLTYKYPSLPGLKNKRKKVETIKTKKKNKSIPKHSRPFIWIMRTALAVVIIYALIVGSIFVFISVRSAYLDSTGCSGRFDKKTGVVIEAPMECYSR
jgi:hypothetical protein